MQYPLLKRLLPLSLLALSGLNACTSGGDVGSGESNLEISQQNYSATSNSSGVATFTFPAQPGAAAMQMIASNGEGLLKVVDFKNASGNTILGQSSAVTAAAAQSQVSPVSVDAPYSGGAINSSQYSVSFLLTSNSKGSSPLAGRATSLTVVSKTDSDTSNGVLKVNLVLAGPVAKDSDTRDALEKAFDIWKEIYQNAGIALDPQWYDIDGPETLPDPRSGNGFYASISSMTRPYAVNIVFGSKVDNLKSPSDKYGLSGALPGPAVPSNRSAIAISVLALTGSDGQFDLGEHEDGSVSVHNNETRLAAEEMARLTGRYLGLENSVDFSGTTVVATDPLNDTPTCLSKTSCQYNEDARSNIMFPYPLPKAGTYPHDTTEYYPRNKITNEQRQVLNNNVLVD